MPPENSGSPSFDKRFTRSKVYVGFGAAFAILIWAGLVAYQSISGLEASVEAATKPNHKLEQLRMLSSELAMIDNEVRTFLQTSDGYYLMDYQSFPERAQFHIDELQRMAGNHIDSLECDSLSTLLFAKIDVWAEMIDLTHNASLQSELMAAAETLPQQAEQAHSEQTDGTKRPWWKRNKRQDDAQDVQSEPTQTSTEQVQQMIRSVSREVESEWQMHMAALSGRDFEIMTDLYELTQRLELRLRLRDALINRSANATVHQTRNNLLLLSVLGAIVATLFIYLIVADIIRHNRHNRQLARAREATEKAAKAKAEFLANMSHEIRTPLNAVIGFSEQLQHLEINEQAKSWIDHIHGAGRHLLHIVNDVLDLSKLDSRKMVFEKTGFEPAKVLNEVTAMLRPNAISKGLKLESNTSQIESTIAVGDPLRLRQVLLNLVSNAIKFTETGSVQINCSTEPAGNQLMYLHVEVRDTGIGIKAEELDRIFTAFEQADGSTTRTYGGTGLGLNIAKQLIEGQNGSLEASSVPGKGSSFRFRIPYLMGDANSLAITETVVSKPVVPPYVTGLTVLVVDDDHYNRKLAQTQLLALKCKPLLAENAKTALELLNSNPIDCMLLDHHMPETSGMELLKQVRERKDKSYSNLPIIITSASSTGTTIQDWEAAGANGALIKPYTQQQLMETLQALKIAHQVQHGDREAKTTPEFDITELANSAEGNSDFIAEMLELFVSNTLQTMDEMEQALAHENWNAIGKMLHRLAPSYNHLKSPLAQDMLRMEEAINAGNIPQKADVKRLMLHCIELATVIHSTI